MLGAIFGDIVGSAYEFHNTHDYDFELLTRRSRPTDDSYMTLAVAKALMEAAKNEEAFMRYLEDSGDEPEIKPLPASLVENMQDIGNRYPDAGYGGMFARWLHEKDPQPYNSFGNGSGMRVSPVGWLYPTLEETLEVAKITAEVTHNHPEGVKGAQAIAAAIFLARAGADKKDIFNYVSNKFQYNLIRTLDDIRPDYTFDETCQGSVPEAIIAFLEGENYEDVIRKAVSLGGDSDTIACMAGGIAEAYYGMPEKYRKETLKRLDEPMRELVREYRSYYLKHAAKPDDSWKQDPVFNFEDPCLKHSPEIEQCIEACYEDPENQERPMAAMAALIDAMKDDAHVLIPTEKPENEELLIDPTKIKPGDIITLKEDMHYKLINLTSPEGEIAMPVFTSAEKMDAFIQGPHSVLSYSLDAYIEQVLEMEEVEGMIMNPGKHSFFLTKDNMKSMSNILKEQENERKDR